MADKIDFIQEDRQNTFLSFLSVFIFQKRYVFFSFLVSILGGAFYYSFSPRYYQSECSLVSPSKNQTEGFLGGDKSSGDLSLVSSLLAASQTNQANQFFIATMTSTPALDYAIKESGLTEIYHLPKVSAGRSLIRRKLKIKEEKGGMIRVSFRNENQKVAESVVANLIVGLNQTLNRLSGDELERSLKFLDTRLALLEKEMSQTNSQRDYRLKEAVYLALLKEREVSRIKAARERMAVDVIDPVEVSEKPVTPRLDLTIVLTLGFGIFLSFLTATLAEYIKILRSNPHDRALLERIRAEFRKRA